MSSKDDVKMHYLEIVRNDEYEQWKNDPRFVGEHFLKRTPGEVLPKLFNRFVVSHLNENFKAWHATLQSFLSFYSSDEVQNMTTAQANSSSIKFEYKLDDLIWESEFYVKARQTLSGVTRKTLVVHMPTDGYFYINGTEMKLLEAPGGGPFEKYFGTVADSVGHPHRDSFVSFVEYNGQGISVQHPMGDHFERWKLFPVTSKGADMTFISSPGEKEFICLLKSSYAAQRAANEFLLSLQDPKIDLKSTEAVQAALCASDLMASVHALMVNFLVSKKFDTDFFLDSFRQYACI